MKVGMIGLGRMGEGMSRRLIDAGHEVWGYRNNYAKAQEQFEAGYISGCTTSLEKPCSSSTHRSWNPYTRRVKISWCLYDGCTSRNSRGDTR